MGLTDSSRWNASLAVSTDGSFPSRPRQLLNRNLQDGPADHPLVQTTEEQRPEHGHGAAEDDSDRLPPGDLAPLRLCLHRRETLLDLLHLLDHPRIRVRWQLDNRLTDGLR